MRPGSRNCNAASDLVFSKLIVQPVFLYVYLSAYLHIYTIHMKHIYYHICIYNTISAYLSNYMHIYTPNEAKLLRSRAWCRRECGSHVKSQMHMIYTYIYIYIERERKRDIERDIYVYIYIYIYT